MQLRKTLLTTLLYAFFVLMLLQSCQKGDTGPAGPTGATGATGAVGATGTANVIYSGWFTPATWVKDTVFGTYGFNYVKPEPLITQPILDSGVVLTFGKLDGYNTAIWPTDQVGQLPITVNYMEGTTAYSDYWSAYLTPGNLTINFIDDYNLYGAISNEHQFRYIIIPGGKSSIAGSSFSAGVEAGHSAAPGHPLSDNIQEVLRNFRSMSYQEVCDKLRIPE